MEFRDQPASPDPPPAEDTLEDAPMEAVLVEEPAPLISSSAEIPSEDLPHLDPIPTAVPVEAPELPVTEIQPDFLRNLELTPGVTAALKLMLEKKNQKENLLIQIKELMIWDTLNEEVRSLFPEDFLDILTDWLMNKMQREVVRQAVVDQNRKEIEYYKKREKLAYDQQRELSMVKKKHQEALMDCDMKNTPHRKPIVAKSNEEELHKLVLKQEEELYSMDRKIVLAIDHLLTAQQKKFEDIGIPGMKESVFSQDILQQMIVIDVISRIAGIDSQAQ